MGQISSARKRKTTEEIEQIARREKISPKLLMEEIAKGRAVIMRHNRRRPERYCGIGHGLKTKINVNIGTSPGIVNLREEEEKIDISEQFNADTIMDLSTGGNLDEIRRFVLKKTKLPVGTVPIYQAETDIEKENAEIGDISADRIFKIIEKNAEDGVDFITVHCGVTKGCLNILKRHPRTMGIVSRGGSFLLEWIKMRKEENPLFAQFDRLLEIAKRYDIVLSLGDGMRPGCIADASDKIQIYELKTLAKLARRALKQGVQAIIEGPGHLPINHIKKNVRWQKRLSHGAPFYVLGPVVMDYAPGYDHITAAIGGAICASEGADFLCYVTPAEHLRLPTIEDVKEGIIATKIAAHTADITKGIAGVQDIDLAISKARFNQDWEKQIELAIDPEKARSMRKARLAPTDDVCSMCGQFCAIKITKKILSASGKNK